MNEPAPTPAPARRILVTGTRHGYDVASLESALVKAADGAPSVVLVHGMARGVDTQAASIAARLGWRVEGYPADWSIGKRAGSLRNQSMVDAGADVCVAAPGAESIGTWDCVHRARAAGIPTTVLPVRP